MPCVIDQHFYYTYTCVVWPICYFQFDVFSTLHTKIFWSTSVSTRAAQNAGRTWSPKKLRVALSNQNIISNKI